VKKTALDRTQTRQNMAIVKRKLNCDTCGQQKDDRFIPAWQANQTTQGQPMAMGSFISEYFREQWEGKQGI
jgi:hypothetical protein